MTNACKAIEERIKSSGGTFNIQMAPKVVTATDEADLAKQMEKAEQENAEVRSFQIEPKFKSNFFHFFKVSGDDDEEEEEVGMGGKASDGDDDEDGEGSD